ncbi:hypothetical protein LEP1GSC161_0096 [Leptospira santarosai str. CBC1416]|nr:hypothetical protein [Leptospira santarosai]EMO20709.1 hypothetical protein LEP1GSC168_0067 [Leptospira santarosai str. HAI134]EMO56019.1 hypothetical protein LEP1GSC161_0096 [Leptospira santarosai str. CBC1416]MDI7202069.1 hypothetical protein [Leptospira santarosai]
MTQEQINIIFGIVTSIIGYFIRDLIRRLNVSESIAYEARNKANQLERDLQYRSDDLIELRRKLESFESMLNELNKNYATIAAILQEMRENQKSGNFK